MTTHTETPKTVSSGTAKRAIRPRRRPDGVYQYDFRFTNSDGEKKRTSVYGETETEVIENHSIFMAGLAAQKIASDLPTMRDYCEEWISGPLAHEDLGYGTKEGYASSLRSHLKDSDLGALPIDKITPADIDKWTHYCRTAMKKGGDRRWSDSTNRFAYVGLTKALNVAVRDGKINSNPAKEVKAPRVRSAKERQALEADDLEYLLRCAKESRFGIVLEFLAQTALRRGEALGLRWSDVDFDQGAFTIRGAVRRAAGVGIVYTHTKTRTSVRTLPLSEPMQSILKRARERQDRERAAAGKLWQENDLVFTDPYGKFMDPRSVNRALSAAGVRAGITWASPHILRHSAATAMMDAGVPETVIANILGHESVRVTRVYEHVRLESMRAAFTKIEN